MTQPRRVAVDPYRVAGWVQRFAASHGEVTWSVVRGEDGRPAAWAGAAADGSWATLQGWGAVSGEFSTSTLEPSAPWMRPPGPLLVVLVRKGGYAVAVTTEAGELVAHKVGTRHVQGRTAAGGWSQQRFARRREGQVDVLVGAVVGHARRVLAEGEETLAQRVLLIGEPPGQGEERSRDRVRGLVVGGDPSLVDRVLDELAVGPLTRL
ncbi:MAG: acVLRF1 family peptidyl-tRNA hydrolase, partial [Mobilicoccus sp.]|nr:acVLRF1 family peptidyl-tRNA hydrolase [Mobilicoccus sp.]